MLDAGGRKPPWEDGNGAQGAKSVMGVVGVMKPICSWGREAFWGWRATRARAGLERPLGLLIDWDAGDAETLRR